MHLFTLLSPHYPNLTSTHHPPLTSLPQTQLSPTSFLLIFPYLSPQSVGNAGGVRCPIGTYNPELGAGSKTKCLPCAMGSYCATTGLADPTDVCDDGFYCESGVDRARPDGKNNEGNSLGDKFGSSLMHFYDIKN